MRYELKIGRDIESATENLLAAITTELGLSYTNYLLQVEFNGAGDESGQLILVLEAAGFAIHSEPSTACWRRWLPMEGWRELKAEGQRKP